LGKSGTRKALGVFAKRDKEILRRATGPIWGGETGLPSQTGEGGQRGDLGRGKCGVLKSLMQFGGGGKRAAGSVIIERLNGAGRGSGIPEDGPVFLCVDVGLPLSRLKGRGS